MTHSLTPRALVVTLLLFATLWPYGAAGQGTGLSLTVNLAEYENSGISGTAYMVETTSGGTHVSMELQGQELEGNHPTHIHTGTCANFDPNPLYPLETVNLSPVNKEGVSDTDIPGVTLASLRDGEFVILVHRSPEQLTDYLVCGEISAGTVGQAAKVKPAEGAAVAHHMPMSGTGERSAALNSTTMVIAATGLALVSLGGAVSLRGLKGRTG